MRAHINVSLPQAERAAAWSRHTNSGRHVARDISRAVEMAQIVDGAHDEANTWSRRLDRYLEGWAEANPSSPTLNACRRGSRAPVRLRQRTLPFSSAVRWTAHCSAAG